MTDVASEYKKSVNTMCENDIHVTAQDVLAKYKELCNKETVADTMNPSVKENKSSNIHKFKKAKSIWKIVVPAAAVFIFSTVTVFAATLYRNEIAQMISQVFGDSTTAHMVENGYFYTINEVQSDKNCKVVLLGVSGDYSNPMIMCDVYLNSKNAALNTDELKMNVSILEKSEYLSNKDKYGTDEVIGVKDEENPRLYHFEIRGYRTHMINEKTVVFDVTNMTYFDGNGKNVSYNPNFTYEFVVPMTEMAKPISYYFYNVTTTYKNVEFTFFYIEYGSYETEVSFHYDQTYDPNSGLTENEYYNMLENIADELFGSSYMELDGVRYDYTAINDGSYDDSNIVGKWIIFEPMHIDEKSKAYFCVNGEKIPAIKGMK